MEVSKEVNTRMQAYLNSEKFENRMQEIVEKTVNDSLESLFSYGEIRDTIKAMFKERIGINLDQMDFAPINQIITDIVKEKTVAAFSEPLRDKLASKLNDMFAPAPKEITVQGIIDIMREEYRDTDGCGCADLEADFEVSIEKQSYGWYLKIWHEGRTRKSLSLYDSTPRENTPTVHLYITEMDDKDKHSIRLIHNLDLKKGLATGIHGLDAKLFMMYCAGTVVSDIDTCDTYHLNLRINDHLDY